MNLLLRKARSMLFPLRVAKTMQAIGVLLRHDGIRTMNCMRLLNLLYIVDRESFQASGRPITNAPSPR